MGGVRRRGLCALAALGLVGAGCGGEEPPPPAPPPGPEVVAPAPGKPPERSVTVRMENLQYMPKEVRVAAGGTVEWENTDSPPHTVTKKDGPGKDFDSGTLQPGQKFSQSFKEPGRVNYICDIHPGQTGVVTVE